MNALDTHRLVKRLVAVGFSDEQAETVTDVVREGREADFSDLATKADVLAVKADVVAVKADVVALKAEVKADIAALRADFTAAVAQLRTEMDVITARFQAAISESKADTLKWVIGMLLVQGGLVVTLIKLLPGH